MLQMVYDSKAMVLEASTKQQGLGDRWLVFRIQAIQLQLNTWPSRRHPETRDLEKLNGSPVPSEPHDSDLACLAGRCCRTHASDAIVICGLPRKGQRPEARNPKQNPEIAFGVSLQSGGFTLANPASLTSASRDRTRKAWTWWGVSFLNFIGILRIQRESESGLLPMCAWRLSRGPRRTDEELQPSLHLPCYNRAAASSPAPARVFPWSFRRSLELS